jgi:outer membrane protein TolC
VVELPNLKELDAQALKNRPLLKAANDQVRVANYAVKQAEAARLPDVSVDYQRSVQTNVDAVLVTASIPLIDFGSVGQAVKAAKETRKQNEAQLTLAKQQVQQQVAQAYADLEVAIQSAADYKKSILDPSSTLLDMAQLGYKQGATGILPVLDAESTLRNARVGYTNSLLAIYKAQDEMLAASGVLLKGGKP